MKSNKQLNQKPRESKTYNVIEGMNVETQKQQMKVINEALNLFQSLKNYTIKSTKT